MADITLFSDDTYQYYFSRVVSGLGAFGVALQNYPAVDLFLRALVQSSIPMNNLSNTIIQAASLSAGGLCSGVVNFWMNAELLDDFLKRMNANEGYQYQQLSDWQKLQYFGGIIVFVVTGILYGLMAFTFAMEGPFATLSIAAGLFVAGIMTIQELETWFASYDKKENVADEPLTEIQELGKYLGHLIAVGNVIALSLLFTLSLAQGLMLLQVAALPAFMTGLSVAFTFGAFTEFYFYDFYLANFCKNFGHNLEKMMAISNAWMGILCISTNAFVNAALTYAGIELLTGLLVAANIALPPFAFITTLAVASAIFAGSASFILGMGFWIRQMEAKPQILAQIETKPKLSLIKSGLSLFPKGKNEQTNHLGEVAKNDVEPDDSVVSELNYNAIQ